MKRAWKDDPPQPKATPGTREFLYPSNKKKVERERLQLVPSDKWNTHHPAYDSFEPTPEQRLFVRRATGYGMKQEDIAKCVINPQTKKPISATTLGTAFEAEISIGYAETRFNVANSNYLQAVGLPAEYAVQYDDRGQVQRDIEGNPIIRCLRREVPRNIIAGIWWEKSRYHLRDNAKVPGDPDDGEGGGGVQVLILIPDNGRDGLLRVTAPTKNAPSYDMRDGKGVIIDLNPDTTGQKPNGHG